MKKNIELKNFIWSTVGSVFFGFTSLIYMVITTRINGINDAGIFTYAFGVACMMFAIGSYSGKTFQITETNEEITDSDYIYNRIITTIIMLFSAFIFCVITNPDFLKYQMIILLTIYRSIDCIIESFHAVTQRNGELYKTGQSLFFKTVLFSIFFLLVDYFTHNMVLATIVIILINIIFFIYDFIVAKKFITFRKFNKKNTIKLFKAGFLIFLFAVLFNYVITAPKYVINFLKTDDFQAILGIILMPASFLGLVSQYIVQPFLNNITNYVKNRDFENLTNMIFKLSGLIIVIGIAAVIVCYFLGIPILELVYGISLSGERVNLLIIVAGSILYSIVVILSSIFITMRKSLLQLIILILDSLFAVIISYVLILKFDMLGASLAYTFTITFLLLLYIIFMIGILNKEKKLMDKKYCVIKRKGEHLGLFSYIITNVGNINKAIKMGRIPVIDMMTYKNCYLEDNEIGDINSWELFFEQPCNIGLKDIEEKSDIRIIESVTRNRPNDSMRFFANKKVQKYWKDIFHKYVKLNKKSLEYIDREHEKIFGKDNKEKVLGILCRGTDYINLKPFRHPVQPTPEEVIIKAKQVMEKYNCTKIFLATEDESILNKFKDEFNNKLLYNDSKRFSNTNSKYLAELSFKRKNDKYLKGIEYLTTIVLLSKCNCLIAGRTSGTIGAVLFSKEFEYTYFWDKGRYKFFPFIHSWYKQM